MQQLIPTINEIIKFGLQPNLKLSKDTRNTLLEKSLINIYSLYFNIEYVFDNTEFVVFNKEELLQIRQNVESNFTDFGLYKKNINKLNETLDERIGDAIDDLTDIIKDLLQIKWRIENNSLADGLWYFQFIFYNHTQQHILDLLNYMKQQNE
ncbi:DUF5063 domain-containing protein [Chryseobacterium binzhouense]|uniref:DUF5063 domain-containing protein n=1 Tax=Chryseobacterium binzhouense TaxID=2593646 RepID=UPI00118112AD|nr:DUF5063 domain-containing protein [Chryseobacterium binzhouense]